MEVDVAKRDLTVVECRPPWQPDLGPQWTRLPIARLRDLKASGLWTPYWRDRNLRFHEYGRVPTTATIEDLPPKIDRDPTGIFWG
jgi:Protein of unknown function (DUF3024)